MLLSLYISNYALIDRLEIDFSSGLNIITGETGSGKSILLGALSLILGERADNGTKRDKDAKTVIEATFSIGEFKDFNKDLQSKDIDINADSCIVRREITAKGTSRAFVNDTPVNLTTLKEITGKLLDIHTQNENLLLADSGFQLDIVDTLAGDSAILEQYKSEFKEYRRALKLYVAFRDALAKNKANLEYNAYLLEQLDGLDLKEGELSQLESERDIVANANDIKNHLTTALDLLSRNNDSILGQIAAVAHELEGLSNFVTDSYNLSDRLNSAKIEISDITDTLLEYDVTIANTNTDLDYIENRIDEINRQLKRHGANSEAELIKVRENLRKAVESAENGDHILLELEAEAKIAKKKAVITARKLSEIRMSAAEGLSEELKQRAVPMGMSNLRCEIRVSQGKTLGDNGLDNVEFLFAFNKNQTLMPVGKTASGGEKSRVILALKSILAQKMHLPTIIFDEIDTGVSGDVANRMAELMLAIGKKTQVIAITHIAAVAAHGDTHFKVFKQDDDSSTNTYIMLLDKEERLTELASMISGDASDTNSLLTAKSLLEKNKN